MRRVPLPEIYSAVSEAFSMAYVGETEVPGIGVVSALGGVEVDWITVFLPSLGDLGSWLGFERIGCYVAISDARFRENIHDPMQRSGS